MNAKDALELVRAHREMLGAAASRVAEVRFERVEVPR